MTHDTAPTPPAHDPAVLPPGLPVPTNDGRAAHLFAARLPDLRLPATDGSQVHLPSIARAVLFFYPRTGVPGQPPSLGYRGEDWDTIPGARGCTPQSCGFRDLHARFAAMGVQVLGVSTSTSDHQREFIARTHVPFPMLSDADLALARAMRLPTFRFPVESGGPDTLLARMAWFVQDGIVQHCWYPVFPPDRNASDVLAWIERRGAFEIVPTTPDDLPFVRDELRRHWITTTIYSRDVRYDADAIPALVAHEGTRPLGLATYAPSKQGWEIVTLSTCEEARGIGGALLARVIDEARAAGASRVFLTTSNDNLSALGFYQRRGFRLARLFPGMIDHYRDAYENSIPVCSADGIPLRDELELEYPLT